MLYYQCLYMKHYFVYFLDTGHSILIYFQLYYHDACFCLLKLNARHMLFFTGQQETEKCSPPLVNMLYWTVVFADKIIQPQAMHIKCQVFECRPSEMIPVVLCSS